MNTAEACPRPEPAPAATSPRGRSSHGGQVLVCVACGESFVHSTRAQAFHAAHQWGPPKRCPTCRQVRREDHGRLVERRECLSCLELFDIHEGEAQFFAARGLHLPRRCRTCRSEAREERVGRGGPAGAPVTAAGRGGHR